MFEQNLPALQISSKTGISYPTTMKALEILRMSIIANSGDATAWLNYIHDQSSAPAVNDSQSKKMAVFGILGKDHEMNYPATSSGVSRP